MSTDPSPALIPIRRLRILLWSGIALIIVTAAGLEYARQPSAKAALPAPNFGGPFTLIDGDGRPFSSASLLGKPYALYFGFTRCGDVCPTTLQRLVRLRRAVSSDKALNIVFITIDPKYDGPREVGQYAKLFDAPIIGLTGSPAQIEQVKKHYGIFSEPASHPMPGREMAHSAIVLLFDRNGRLLSTISPDDPDQFALAKLNEALA